MRIISTRYAVSFPVLPPPPTRYVHRILLMIATWVALGFSEPTFAQTMVSGTVNDASGNGIQNVSIALKNGSAVSTTNPSGNFSISVPGLNGMLVFTHVGYQTIEIAINGRRNISVNMDSRDQVLDAVVVTGYSTQRRKDITGSVSVININELQDQPVVSVGQALQGMASGVNVITPASPGAGAQIRIRGISSFGNTEPLVIVDGIEQSLTHINPEDIESIQVLKDAGSAAIYGVRGSNGVIVVTTKKGKNGPPVVSYDASYRRNFPLPGNVWDLMNTTDYAAMYNGAFPGNALFGNGIPDYTYRGPSGSGAGNEGDPAVDPSLYFFEKRNTGRNYIIQSVNKDREDWFHHLFKPAGTLDQNLSVSGGTTTAKYMFGLGYTDWDGTLIHSNYKRYSLRLNSEFNIAKGIRIGENANIRHRQSTPTDGSISSTYAQMPGTPLTDIMGNWAGTFGGPGLGTTSNPVGQQHRNALKDDIKDWDLAGNLYLEVDFLKYFTARTSIGVTFNNGYDFNYTGTAVDNAELNTSFNSLSVSNGYSNLRTFTNTLTYNQQFGKHRVKALGGFEAIKNVTTSVSGTVNGFFVDDMSYLDLDNGTQNLRASSQVGASALYSLFADADYVYNDKYLLGATIRRDGSSRFGAKNRYGVFPSASAGWRISQEPFMASIGWIDELLIRGSYGILGSQNDVSSTNAFSLYGSGPGTTNYDIRGTSTSIVQGFAQTQIGNPFTGWEEDKISNIGFDATFFNRKLDVSVEYYKKAIKGLLFSEPLPAVVLGGATPPTINIGDIQNAGFDVSLRYRNKISEHLRYNAGLNVTTYKNEVVNIPDPGYFQAGSQDHGFVVRNQEGHPVSAFYGYKIIGLFNSTEEVTKSPTQTAAAPGRFKYQDTNGDNIISAADQVFLGNPNPDFTYGLTLGLDYKKISFSALFYGSQGNDIYNVSRERLDFFQKYFGGKSNRLKRAWTPENTNTNIPKVETSASFSTNGVPTSYFVEDGSYLKLRSVTLGYNMNESFLKKIGVNKFRLFVQGANLFNITKYSGLDPELTGGPSAFGIDNGHYPAAEASVVFGINASF